MSRVIHLFPWKAVVGAMRGSVPRESRRLIDALRIACVAMETALAFSGFSLAIYRVEFKKKASLQVFFTIGFERSRVRIRREVLYFSGFGFVNVDLEKVAHVLVVKYSGLRRHQVYPPRKKDPIPTFGPCGIELILFKL